MDDKRVHGAGGGLPSITLWSLLRHSDPSRASGAVGGSTTGSRTGAANPDDTPLVALLPDDPLLDDEGEAAAALGMTVMRFVVAYDGNPEITSPPAAVVAHVTPCRALFRGFMMPGDKYARLYSGMEALGVHMVTPPDAYERVHYYPNSYGTLADVSPRACWIEVKADAATPSAFASALARIRGHADATTEAPGGSSPAQWAADPRCEYVVLKDYVKSAKHSRPDLLRVRVDDELPQRACELVAARGLAFNRGVVFKELVPTKQYAVASTAATGDTSPNEWRLWFGRGKLLVAAPNSAGALLPDAPRVPASVVARAAEAARELGAPFLTVDFAERDTDRGGGGGGGGSASGTHDGDVDGWFCLETGAGSVSGPALEQDLGQLWRALHDTFKFASP